jgi:ABC-type transport system substrate-binding protein
MERQFVARILQSILLIGVGVLLILNIAQNNHLEELVIESRKELSSVQRSIDDFRNQLERGNINVSGGGREGDADGGDYFRQFYSDEEWEALHEPGNLLELPEEPTVPRDGKAGGTLHRAFAADLPSLIPLGVNAADVSELYSYIGSSLAGRSRHNPERWVPGLAYRIEANEERTEYHIWLREGVKWHRPAVDFSGDQFDWLDKEHEVVADDFVFFFELMRNSDVPVGYLRNYYQNCEGIEVINDHEFIVRWSESEFTSMSATLGLGPLPRWLYAYDRNGEQFPEAELGQRFMSHWYSQKAIGTGPFRFVSWEPGGSVRVERNPNYFGEKPLLEAIEFRVLSDPTARLNSLLAGELDYTSIEPTQYKTEIVEGGADEFEDGTINYETFSGPAYRYLGWNADGPYFSDRRVRLAMTHAFNRELTIERNMNGLGSLTTGPFFQDNPAYNDDVEPWPYDLDRAAELLNEAGWVDRDDDGVREKTVDGREREFSFDMLTYGHRPEIIAAMEIYREDLRSLGIQMDIETVDWSVMIERMQNKDFDAYTGGWSLGWEVDLYQVWHSSQADIPRGSNRVGFRNEEADEIITASRTTFDPEERTELFHRFHEIVHNEQPYTFWFQIEEVGAWHDEVENVSFSAVRPFDYALGWYLSGN